MNSEGRRRAKAKRYSREVERRILEALGGTEGGG